MANAPEKYVLFTTMLNISLNPMLITIIIFLATNCAKNKTNFKKVKKCLSHVSKILKLKKIYYLCSQIIDLKMK